MAVPEPDPADAAGFFASLSEELVVDHDVEATLQRICQHALVVVPSGAFAALTVRRRRGRLETLAHTDETALQCDHLQYDLNEGPCIDSAVEDEPFLVHRTEHDERWPRWGPKVADLGVHSLISVQLSSATLDPDRDPLGAINLYGRAPGTFDLDDVNRLRIFGVHAGNALAVAHLVTTLREAVDARHEVGLAQGILMSRYDLDRDQAFESLQRYSSNANVKLREVAAHVIDNGSLPEEYDEVDAAT